MVNGRWMGTACDVLREMESRPSKYENHRLSEENAKSKKQFMQKEKSLRSLGGHISGDSRLENSLSEAPVVLTLEDLGQPGHPQPRDSVSMQKHSTGASGRDPVMSAQDKDSLLQMGSLRSSQQENMKLREKMNSLQEQNSSLTSQNRSLVNKIKTMQLELTKSKSKVRFYESSLGNHPAKIPELEEQIICLEAESEAQSKALRIAEEKLLENRNVIIEKDNFIQECREELKSMKIQLYECSKQYKRTEKQRNEALCNAEELTRAFQQYKKNVTEKLEKIQKEEEQRSKTLQSFEREREELQEKCRTLERELEDVKEHLSHVTSERTDEEKKLKSVVVNNTELISLLTLSNQRVVRLENELENKEKVLRENATLLQDNKELKDRLSQLEELNRTGHSSSESGNVQKSSQPDDSSLLIMELRAQLSLKDAENRELQARLLSLNSFQSLDVEPVKLPLQQIEAEKYLSLETTSKQLQMEKEKLAETVKELQRKLGKAQTELANARLSMAQRTSQFQLIQEELLGKVAKATKLEQEITKKSQKITSLQKLVEEKSQAYTAAITRNAELEEELEDCRAQIIRLEENISKEHREVLQAFEKSKTIHQEQHNELRKQNEHLQCQLEVRSLQIAEQEFTIKALQEETASKQLQLRSLDSMLTDTKKALEHQTHSTADAMKMLENQVEEESVKVRQLEAALAICKEELGLYLQQLEDNRRDFEEQIRKKTEEVQCLRKEIKLKTQNLQETGEENLRLQQTLHQQQQMLQQETARIGELEDTQAQLQKQISKLELELEKQRSAFQGEKKTIDEKLQTANKELSLKIQQAHELKNTIKRLECELDSCAQKLLQTEGQLLAVTVDGESKNSKLSQLDLNLQKTQTELDDKIQLVALLQERVSRAEKDLKRKEEIEIELGYTQKELQNNLKQVEALQETLTQTHLLVEEKEVIIQALTEELRTCRNDLEERDNELLDMDQALKDRNWELKQRAAQLTQLDMSIRQHKEELEQKVIHLETALKKYELENHEHNKQISSLDEKLQEMREKLREKEIDLLQRDQFANQLQKEMEKKQLAVTEMEQRLAEQRSYISEQQEEGKELNQQVRLARERMQFTHRELLETREQLAEAQKESDRLKHKLEGMDRLSREKLQQVKQDLEDAQDTICNLKTEVEARNEVIKATNEVLILKESELTRMKARISGFERKLGLQHQLATSTLSPDILSEYDLLESLKFHNTSDLKNWGLQRSVSDTSLTDISSLDPSKNIIDDVKGLVLPNPPLAKPAYRPSDSLKNTSFNPLEYTVDDHSDKSSDCPDLGTLSGMLKYIKQEMKFSEASQAHSPERNLWTEDDGQEKQN
ncbi:coiled-coil domain-containing protein 18 isoform X2 [Hyperolius riggenbachi]|uniref:coiled-coil domain-containing protein 18 isoform X2 n=1 Tax=Hyperolius riggenbachi TaxID=752182 RepID=UPI0035A31847